MPRLLSPLVTPPQRETSDSKQIVRLGRATGDPLNLPVPAPDLHGMIIYKSALEQSAGAWGGKKMSIRLSELIFAFFS